MCREPDRAMRIPAAPKVVVRILAAARKVFPPAPRGTGVGKVQPKDSIFDLSQCSEESNQVYGPRGDGAGGKGDGGGGREGEGDGGGGLGDGGGGLGDGGGKLGGCDGGAEGGIM